MTTTTRPTGNNIFTNGWKANLLLRQPQRVKEAQDEFPDIFSDEVLDEMFSKAEK